jgi:hypothetical protein
MRLHAWPLALALALATPAFAAVSDSTIVRPRIAAPT